MSELAASISKNIDGIQLVEMASFRLKQLCPQVIHASRVLCSLNQSQEARQNMDTYKHAWLKELRLLILAIDDIISINDFLAVQEALILLDIQDSINGLNCLNVKEFSHSVTQVISRTRRVCEVVNSEMSNFEKCDFTSRVIETVQIIRDGILSNFVQSAEYAKKALISQPMQDPNENENEFIDASRTIYDSIRELRNALLLIPQEDDWESIEDEEIVKLETVDENIKEKENEQLGEVDDEETETSNLLNSHNITQEQKEQISQELDSFNNEKKNFDKEVLKWSEQSNDIIVLSKEMCVIMMDMTSFTRGKGPYRTTESIIGAAKKISQLGSRLEKLIKELSDSCPESQSKVELLSYLKKLPLFLNQLNVVSKVKENVIDVDKHFSDF